MKNIKLSLQKTAMSQKDYHLMKVQDREKLDAKQYRKLVKDIDLSLKHISIEMCSIGSKKSSEQLNILPIKKKYLKLKKEWEQIQSKNLFNESNRQDLQKNNEYLDQNQKLLQSKKLLYDMEDLSGQISENLSKQGGQIRGATNKVKQVNSIIGSANKIIDIMMTRQNRRANAVKIVLFTVFMIIAGVKICCY